MSQATRTKSDINKQGWETAEFPIVCEICLGENPYVRMTKDRFGAPCKVCQRPFTVFQWKAGTKGRYKRTEICQTCAKIKNVCQTCIFDLQYGLPVQVRDAALGLSESSVPRGDVNREFFAQNAEMRMEDGQTYFDYTKLSPAGHEMLKKLARQTPNYNRNREHVCSFFVKGHCSRGDECPYRHEDVQHHEVVSDKNIKDRFYGSNDPMAQKIINKVLVPNVPISPEDKTITTLFMSGITDEITETDIRDKFFVFGEIKSCHVVHKSYCAFVTFANRASAEKALQQLYDNLEVKGLKLRLNWGRQQQVGSQQNQQRGLPAPGLKLPGGTMFLPPPPPPPGASGYYYQPVTADLGAKRPGEDTSSNTPNKRQNK